MIAAGVVVLMRRTGSNGVLFLVVTGARIARRPAGDHDAAEPISTGPAAPRSGAPTPAGGWPCEEAGACS
jgi:hypothetical protein